MVASRGPPISRPGGKFVRTSRKKLAKQTPSKVKQNACCRALQRAPLKKTDRNSSMNKDNLSKRMFASILPRLPQETGVVSD